MRVCLVHGEVSKTSGSGRYIQDVATRFAEDGHAVTVICHQCDEQLRQLPGLEVVTVARPPSELGLWRAGHLGALVWNWWHVNRGLAGRSFDAVVGSDLLFLRPLLYDPGRAHRFVYTPLSMIAPLEIASYELGGLRGSLGVRLYSRLQRWALMNCSTVVRFTRSAVGALERYYGLDLENKALIAVYVSREFEQPVQPDAPPARIDWARPRPAELLWVGRLVKSKNVGFLLRAASHLRSSDWVLNICSDGPERRQLEVEAVNLGIGGRTKFLGTVDDVAALYRRASVLLTGSVLEQYSLTLMEAYAFGVPCVGLRPDWKRIFNSLEDQIVDGATGYVVRDEPEMALRIDQLLADEPLRQRLARQAYMMKASGYTFEGFYNRLREAAST